MAYDASVLTMNPIITIGSTSIYSGVARVGQPGMVVAGAPAEQFGFWVPEAPPLEDPAAIAGLVADAWLMGFTPKSNMRQPIGVEQVRADYLPDPRGGPSRWLHLSGTAYAANGITIGFRITAQRTG